MVWNINTSCGHESAKVAGIAVPYLQGQGLDLGCGVDKVWPSCIGVDSCKDYGGQKPPAVDVQSEADDLPMFADKSMDYVFSSHLLEHIVDYKAALREWWRVIKPGGYLILYLPHKKLYPNIGEEGSNPDHKHDFLPDDIIKAMKKIGSWTLLENEERDQSNEYSFYQVYRKEKENGVFKHDFNVWERNPDGKKRLLLIRYGAIGDALQMASVLPELKKQGWHITINCTSKTKSVLENDPHVDEWLIQEQDFVPNHHLGPYWEQIRFDGRYDKIVNLCESIEGALLSLPGRLQHTYTDEVRRKLMGTVNYLERTHDLCEVPYRFAPKFYPSDEEHIWARKQVKKAKGMPVIAWPVSGSALHKVYPWLQVVVGWLIRQTPCHVFLLGDDGQGKQIQDAVVAALKEDGVDMKRVHKTCGKWSLRETLTFVQHADAVVGPETGPMNAVCMMDLPKIIYLSHSSEENLTKHWVNTTVLQPDTEKCPCYPCHKLIYSWDDCVQDETTNASLCASSIAPERVFEAIVTGLGLKRATMKTGKPKSFTETHPEAMMEAGSGL